MIIQILRVYNQINLHQFNYSNYQVVSHWNNIGYSPRRAQRVVINKHMIIGNTSGASLRERAPGQALCWFWCAGVQGYSREDSSSVCVGDLKYIEQQVCFYDFLRVFREVYMYEKMH